MLPIRSTADAPHSWIYRKVVDPVLTLIRLGASPERLAWSLALGVVIGINPVIGSTTVACLVIAFALRLNLVASQLTNHLVYPLQLVLFLPLLRLGTRLFRSQPMPISPSQLLHTARTNPLELTRQLWLWESHALLAWLLLALQLAAFACGNVMYPTYKVEVRTAYLENTRAIVAERAARGEPATAELVRSAARAARWFDVKEHWVALGTLASAALLLVLVLWDPERGQAARPIALGLAYVVASTLWLAAIIGVLTASWRAV